jgi:DNA polymerase-3 subunit gamma/tau
MQPKVLKVFFYIGYFDILITNPIKCVVRYGKREVNMAYIALYRKWRPLVFEDVIEQQHVVQTLKHSVSTGRIAHAYLFCGTRGTGKTTMAHILSRAINCLKPQDGNPCNQCEICKGILSGNLLDVLEIDAASNNSVDNVREIREEVIYAPSRAKYKVYIVDEVHMLSSGAFNALLKTLEEPPEHVVFILATTEPHKLPATVLSRCQRFDFRRITIGGIIERLEKIARSSCVILQKEALRLIARMADGALRDAISLLDQCISLGRKEISYNDVLAIVGAVNDTFMSDMVRAVGNRNVEAALELVEKLVMDGKDISQFVSDLITYYRNLLICKVAQKPEEILDVSYEAIDEMKSLSSALSREEITCIIKELSLLGSGLKWSNHPRIMLEVSLIKLCENSYSFSNDEILERLSVLESKINNAVIAEKSPLAVAQDKDEAQPPADSNKIVVKTEKKSEKPASSISEKPVPKHGHEFNLTEIWNSVLNKFKNSGRMVFYSYLTDTKAVWLGEKLVGITFKQKNAFNKENVSKSENIQLIEKILGNMLGREIRVKCLDENELDTSPAAKPEDKKEDWLEKAQSIAEKLDIPLNIIDE